VHWERYASMFIKSTNAFRILQYNQISFCLYESFCCSSGFSSVILNSTTVDEPMEYACDKENSSPKQSAPASPIDWHTHIKCGSGTRNCMFGFCCRSDWPEERRHDTARFLHFGSCRLPLSTTTIDPQNHISHLEVVWRSSVNTIVFEHFFSTHTHSIFGRESHIAIKEMIEEIAK
jgi:hypothetical protein